MVQKTGFLSPVALAVFACEASDGLFRPADASASSDAETLQVADATSDALDASTIADTGQTRLLSQADLGYLGAFRLPAGTFGGSSFAYGGTAMTYRAETQSLFMAGHDWDQMVAEVAIPDIRMGAKIADLATATVVQPFVDATAGKMKTIGRDDIKVGGLMAYEQKLIGTAYVYYDAAHEQTLSHFTASFNLADASTAKGMYQVGTLGAGYVSGYMSPIPKEWQNALGGPALTGQCCIPIVSRTSFGPGVAVFDPKNLGVDSPLKTVPLLYYTEEHATLGKWGATSKMYNGTSGVGGIIFASGTRSVLFMGTHGVGPWCYGTGGSSGGNCYDPSDMYKGNHAYPYVHQVWAYDVEDFVKVRNGSRKPWEIVPYSIWNFDLPFQTASRAIGSVAYDDASRRAFVSESNADGDLPIIHVFSVK